MRIGIVADPFTGLAPDGAGYWYRTYHLVEALVRRGHDVTAFAAHTSQTSARLVSPGDMTGWGEAEYRNIENGVLGSASFDLLSITGFKGTFFAPFARCPVLHNLAFGDYWDEACRVLADHRDQLFSANSRALTQVYPHLNWQGVVRNGVRPEDFPFEPAPEEFLFSFGRITPEKGTHLAIEVAERTGRPLVIGGAIWSDAYFEDEIAPRLNPRIRYVGDLSFEEKLGWYRRASAFLFPIRWEEAFGNVMLEALACGTPVIALRRGAVPEVVRDGETGFVCDDVEQMAGAVDRLGSIRRDAARADCERRFSTDAMTDGYERLFGRIAAA